MQSHASLFILLVAAIATIAAVVAGVLAWQWELDGQKQKGILLMHLVTGCMSSLLYLGSMVHAHENPASTRRVASSISLSDWVVAAIFVAVTGHFAVSHRSEWTWIEAIQNVRDDASVIARERGLGGSQPAKEARSHQALSVTCVCQSLIVLLSLAVIIDSFLADSEEDV